jgi:predicted AlkP superfamily pyrophosphatase or phosphodiesterase
MSLRIVLPLLLALVASTSTSAAAEPVKRVLIIGIDGCRPDALQAANTPHLDALIAEGMWFEGTDIREPEATDAADTVSGPGWSNLLTGVWPDKHGVLDNKFTAPQYDRYPHMFARLKEAKPSAVTASFSTWKPITDKIVSAADVSREFSDDTKDWVKFDRAAALACADYLAISNPDLTVLYQGQVDETGHKHGFHPSVPEYIAAIETVDANLGEVLQARKARKTFADESWLTIVCTDHGGLGTGHGDGHKEPDIRTTFLIVSGPAAARGKSEEPTWQVDVAATALTHLGDELKPEWELDGRAVGLNQ